MQREHGLLQFPVQLLGSHHDIALAVRPASDAACAQHFLGTKEMLLARINSGTDVPTEAHFAINVFSDSAIAFE